MHASYSLFCTYVRNYLTSVSDSIAKAIPAMCSMCRVTLFSKPGNKASHYCSITFTLHLLIPHVLFPPLYISSLPIPCIRVCKSSDGYYCSTVECKSQMLPWKLLLRLFSNVLFLLLGKSYSLILFHCWLLFPFSIDLPSCRGLGRVKYGGRYSGV